jgi:hypothetical protein
MNVEWWVVVVTLAGPVIAVQTQEWIEKATETRRRRSQIFYAPRCEPRLAEVNLIDAYINSFGEMPPFNYKA